MGHYEKHEAACQQIRKSNESLLIDFAASLKASGLSQKTIDKHVYNINFYVNEFLLYEDEVEAAEGAHRVSMFLGYWFIRKAMWSSQASIKSNAASIKKFYRFMVEAGKVNSDALADLNETIKEEMPDWLEAVRRYD